MSEADRLKRVRGVEIPGSQTRERPPGARPIRMKGYHRAVKAGEPWAVELSKKTGFQWILGWYFHNVDWKKEIARESTWVKSIPIDNCWEGSYMIVPFKIGKESSND